MPRFSNSLPLLPRAGTATCWAPPSGTQEAQSRRKWTQPPGGVTPFIECKQKANNWDMVGLCDLTLASNFPVQLAAQRRRKKHKNLCIKKKNVKEKMKRTLND